MKKLIFLFSFIISVSTSAQHWAEMGNFDNGILSFYEDTVSDELFIGGGFYYYNTDTLVGIAKWNGHNMTTLGCGIAWDCITMNLTGNIGSPTGIIRYKNNIFLTGSFVKAGNKIVNGITMWDGSNWNNFNSGLKDRSGGMGIGLGFKIINDTLYLLGIFDSIAGIKAHSLAKFDGNHWSEVHNLPSINIPIQMSPNWISDIEYYQNEIYACGNFYNTSMDIYNIIKWDGSNWVSVGNGIRGSMISLNKMLVYHGRLIVAGMFTSNQYPGNPGDNISSWDGSQWIDMIGGTDDIVKDIRVHNDTLYACGTFEHAGGIPADHIARWDGTKWCGFGSNFNNVINTLDFYHDTLFIGGGFWTIDGDSIMRFAKWIGGSYIDSCGSSIGIEQNEDQQQLVSIFPNPANNTLNIVGIAANAIAEVYDISGKLILTPKLITPQLDISALAQGMYFIKLTTKEGSVVRKFIKE
ncbi:MAG: T9SS type A sorting domain-containing protein [Bacteroidota bacterium]